MIKSFFGNDRVRALAEIEKFLGKDHETIDGSTLDVEDLPSVFFGATFFETKRRILINDLTKNTAVFSKLPELLKSPHQIALLDFTIDKRTATYKALKNQIEFLEYNLEKPPVYKIAYQIYDQAEKNLPRALELLKPLKENEVSMYVCGPTVYGYVHIGNMRPVITFTDGLCVAIIK